MFYNTDVYFLPGEVAKTAQRNYSYETYKKTKYREEISKKT